MLVKGNLPKEFPEAQCSLDQWAQLVNQGHLIQWIVDYEFPSSNTALIKGSRILLSDFSSLSVDQGSLSLPRSDVSFAELELRWISESRSLAFSLELDCLGSTTTGPWLTNDLFWTASKWLCNWVNSPLKQTNWFGFECAITKLLFSSSVLCRSGWKSILHDAEVESLLVKDLLKLSTTWFAWWW